MPSAVHCLAGLECHLTAQKVLLMVCGLITYNCLGFIAACCMINVQGLVANLDGLQSPVVPYCWF